MMMKKLSLLLLALACAAPALAQPPQADWQIFYTGTDGSRGYYDRASVAGRGDVRTVRIRPSNVPGDEELDTVVMTFEFNCASRSSRAVSGEVTIAGRTERLPSPEETFRAARPGTPAHAMIGILCAS
jgi:hypothetical protein